MAITVNLRDARFGSRLRAWIEAQIRRALPMDGPELVSVGATLSDENGPKGGVDVRCNLVIQTRRFGPLSFVTEATAPAQAVRAALRRARRLVRRKLDKQRQARRPVPA